MYIPFYRGGWGYGYPGYGYAYGYPAWNYGGYGGYGTNVIGSAIAGQSVINTGTAAGINQIATPSVIY
jgi:hypothetical protein